MNINTIMSWKEVAFVGSGNPVNVKMSDEEGGTEGEGKGDVKYLKDIKTRFFSEVFIASFKKINGSKMKFWINNGKD